MRSLRRTLSVRHGLTMMVALAAIAVGTYVGIRRMMERQLDQGLRHSATLQLDIIATLGTPVPHTGSQVADQFASGMYRAVALRDSSGRVRAQNLGLPDGLPLSRPAFEAARHGRTVLTDETWEGARLRSIYLPAPSASGARVLEVTASTRPLETDLRRLALVLLGTVLLASLAAFLGADWLAAGSLRSVEDIVRQAETITGQRPGERLAIDSDVRECASLVAVLNGMLDRLERAHAWHRRVMRDLGHDLRTPITALRTGVEVALWTNRKPDEYRRVLADTLEEIERLTLISDALVQLGRLEFGPGIERASVDLRAVAAEAVGRARQRMDGHGFLLMPGGAVMVFADRRLMGSVLDQLFDNALRHTPPGTTIRVSVGEEQGAGELVVEDNGPGVPEDILTQIFEQFYRGDAARGREAGPGLGLTLVAAIVARHEGTVRAERRDESGLRIRIRIPLAEADAPAGTAHPALLQSGAV